MEAKSAAALPDGPGWLFEPKWDGFRCLVFRDRDSVALQSKSGEPLEGYFPEVAAVVRSLRAERLVLDGELIIAVDSLLSFEALQMRLHPAESRIRKLSAATPARPPGAISKGNLRAMPVSAFKVEDVEVERR